MADAIKKDYGEIIKRAAAKYGLPPELIHAIIQTESSGRAKAFNPEKGPLGGSYGLMQLRIPTAQMMGFKGKKEELFSPETNVDLGSKYLAYQMKRYKNDLDKVISAYNAGTATTKNPKYVEKVQRFLAPPPPTIEPPPVNPLTVPPPPKFAGGGKVPFSERFVDALRGFVDIGGAIRYGMPTYQKEGMAIRQSPAILKEVTGSSTPTSEKAREEISNRYMSSFLAGRRLGTGAAALGQSIRENLFIPLHLVGKEDPILAQAAALGRARAEEEAKYGSREHRQSLEEINVLRKQAGLPALPVPGPTLQPTATAFIRGKKGMKVPKRYKKY